MAVDKDEVEVGTEIELPGTQLAEGKHGHAAPGEGTVLDRELRGGAR